MRARSVISKIELFFQSLLSVLYCVSCTLYFLISPVLAAAPDTSLLHCLCSYRIRLYISVMYTTIQLIYFYGTFLLFYNRETSYPPNCLTYVFSFSGITGLHILHYTILFLIHLLFPISFNLLSSLQLQTYPIYCYFPF